jgi:biopolymer transport protein ExbB
LLVPRAAPAEATGAAPKASSLADLLQQVREGAKREEAENRAREAEFRAAQDRQRAMLESAMKADAHEQARAEKLEAVFEEQENTVAELETTLRNRLGSLGELFGVVRQAAGEAKSQVETSIISAQIPGREVFLDKLAQSKELPAVADLEKLWFSLQEEMTEQGRIVSFPATVVEVGGQETERQVVRVGPFNAVSEGRYLSYQNGKLTELARQPASRYLSTVAHFETATAGLEPIAIDPSRGTILSMLIQTPNLDERIRQGGIVGYVTIALGVVGFAYALYRIVVLTIASRRIRAQVAEPSKLDRGNALGRVLAVYLDNQQTDVESLELRLDEAILKESASLLRGATFVKVLSVIAPLLGLLGTVTGMILTFQMITLFGAGDPKLMAGGISQALVTTVLGLVMAIPLTLLHSMIAERGKTLVQILEEHSVGIVAEHAERLARHTPAASGKAA